VQVMDCPTEMVIVAGANANLAMLTATACPCAGTPPLTGTAPDWTTILRGALPTGIVVVTALLVRSTTETSFDFSLVTYAKWLSEVAAIQCGILPTLTVPVAALLAGSNRSS